MALQKRRRGPARTAHQRSAWMRKSGENRPMVQACPNCGAPSSAPRLHGVRPVRGETVVAKPDRGRVIALTRRATMRVVVDAMGSDRAPARSGRRAARRARARPSSVDARRRSRVRLEAELARAAQRRRAARPHRIVHAHRGRHDGRPSRRRRFATSPTRRCASPSIARRATATATRSSPPATAARCSRRAVRARPAARRRAARDRHGAADAGGAARAVRRRRERRAQGIAARAVRRARRRLRSRRPRPRAPAPRPALERRASPARARSSPAKRTRSSPPPRTADTFQYVGYVEGSDLFRGVVDVIATDGFTGNVVLKTCEGIAEGMFGLVRQELEQDRRSRGSAPRSSRPRCAASPSASTTPRSAARCSPASPSRP